MRRSSVVGWKSSLVNDCVGMDEAAVGCVVLAGLSLPGPLMVCVDLDSPCSVYGLLWNLAAWGGAHHCEPVNLRVLRVNGQIRGPEMR